MRNHAFPKAAIVVAIAAALSVSARAAVVRQEPSRFDALQILDPSSEVGAYAESPESLPEFGPQALQWKAFASSAGGPWRAHLDRRTGSPLLVEGSGLTWLPAGSKLALVDLESKGRAFLAAHESLFRVRTSELRLDSEGSAWIDGDRARLVFRREVDGIEVEGERLVMHVVRGRLVAFGADRWGEVGPVPDAAVTPETARETLYRYMGLSTADAVTEIESGRTVLVPAVPEGAVGRAWKGAVGSGIRFLRAYVFALRVAGEPGTWVGKVDAASGRVIALYDDDKYAHVKGGAYPMAADGNCADFGCMMTMGMPYADVTIDGVPGTANDVGIFDCNGANASTTLIGPYVRINEICGALTESVACDADLDLQQAPATNCSVPAGDSSGNTNAARTAFYTVNRVKEKGRFWLPTNAWLQGQVQVNTNVNSTCNATWSGQLNMYRAGNGCRNTAETAGVLTHEFGHGLDENDGGGYDNPSEAYADVVAIIEDRRSCVGRGFYESQVCSGYGDTCLSCTGIRDMDWDARQAHTPATPQNFIDPHCGGGGGACGRETHCEAYPPGETIYDLATRDLPASGIDPTTAWQLTERLFYKSRLGSGGNVYNCALPSSDGCNANGWYVSMRTADDDDGNLANGTPHAAAIYAAFARHNIACGSVNDPSNQSTSSCPAIAAPTLTGTAGSSASVLTWSSVSGASNYLVLRNEQACDRTQNVITTVPSPGTGHTDIDLPNGLPFYYRVQAQGANTACYSPVSNCVQITPQPFAGSIKFDRGSYSCSSVITLSVLDANIGAPTTTATIASTSEPTPESLVLTETSPGSAKYVATITTTSGPAVPGDGFLSIQNGDALTAVYVDADDGMGGTNLTRQASALGDCVVPLISQIHTSGITDVRATILWSTNEASTSVVAWGPVKPPANTASAPGFVNSHSVDLLGLQACTIYWYAVRSQDPAGNLATDDLGGQYHVFETLGDLGSGLQGCHSGRLTVGKSVVSCADTLPIKVTDLDLNLSPTAIDSVAVTVTSTTQITPVSVVLTETGLNTSNFTGSIQTTAGPTTPGDGKIQVAGGDVITATYNDADNGAGSSGVSFASASADCAGPVDSSIFVVSIEDDRATVSWTTTEPTTGWVDWGSTPALGSTATHSVMTTSHQVVLTPLNECGTVYFRVTSTDAYGNVSVYDVNGSPYTFNAGRIPPGVFKDEFESPSGWTLQGDWQIGAPQGLGTPGDPASAFSGTKVLGQDLTGLGSSPGNYEAGSGVLKATSPSINASTLTGGRLHFRRKLNVAGDSATATIAILRGAAFLTVWDSSSVSDTGWISQTIDLGGAADGHSNVKIIFQQVGPMTTDGRRSGWNIDRVVLNSSSQPAFEACGACGGAPAFDGLRTAVDANPCASTGITLTWPAAPSWGTGSAGTYSVYRDTTPGFTPSAGNRIATGLAGTSYGDATAPVGTTVYYLVRAENNETCSTGPNNGGRTDANTVYLSARNDITQPPPGSVGASLLVDPVNDAHVRLSWSAAVDVAKYRVYRSQTPNGTFGLLAETTATSFDDLGQMSDPTTWYYVVRSADACGNEVP